MRKLLLVLSSLILLSHGYIAQVPTDGLVAEYTFTDGSTQSTVGEYAAFAPANNNVSIVADRFGNENSALQVTPVGGWINFHDSFDEFTTGPNAEFTYSFWVKLNSFDDAYRVLFAKAAFESSCNTAGRQYTILVNPEGKLQVQAFGSLTGGHVRVNGNTVLSIGEWHHVVVAMDMATVLTSLPATTGLSMYIDGVLQTNTIAEVAGVGISTDGMDDGPVPLAFGTYLYGVGSFASSCVNTQDLNGQLDDFRVYNRAITPSEVSALFNEGECAPIPSIAQQPQNTIVCDSPEEISIAITPTGSSYFFVWEWFDGNDWVPSGFQSSGTDGSTISVFTGLEGQLRVRVDDNSCMTTVGYSDEFTIDYIETISITEDNGVLQVAEGYDTYVWSLNGNPISGASGNTYTPTLNGGYTVEATLSGCTRLSGTFNFTGAPTGISQLNSSKLSVYPNPFDAYFMIECEASNQLIVTNALGKLVHTQAVNGSTRVDASNFPPGMYIIRMESSNYFFKLLKN